MSGAAPAATLSIERLALHPHLAPVLARWFHEAWVAIEGIPVEALEAELLANLPAEHLPVTWVAFEAGRLVGTVSIDVCDLPGHEHLSPWLASFYVVADRRGGGVGRTLLRHAQRYCTERGVGVLYLWTAGTTRLYEALGWARLEAAHIGAHAVTVMRWQSSASPGAGDRMRATAT